MIWQSVFLQGTHSLTLEQLAGLFYILLGGLTIAVLITLLHIIKRTLVEEQINLSRFTSVLLFTFSTNLSLLCVNPINLQLISSLKVFQNSKSFLCNGCRVMRITGPSRKFFFFIKIQNGKGNMTGPRVWGIEAEFYRQRVDPMDISGAKSWHEKGGGQQM